MITVAAVPEPDPQSSCKGAAEKLQGMMLDDPHTYCFIERTDRKETGGCAYTVTNVS